MQSADTDAHADHDVDWCWHNGYIVDVDGYYYLLVHYLKKHI